MAVFCCKMCSAPLEILEENKLARCTYCGTLYTLPLEEQEEKARMDKADRLMDRARMALNDQEFKMAEGLFDKVLNILPSLGEAYLGKGMAELEVSTLRELTPIRRQAAKNYFIGKALVFCVQPLRAELYHALGLRDKKRITAPPKKTWLQSANEQRSEFARVLHEKYCTFNEAFEEQKRALVDPIDQRIEQAEKNLEQIGRDIERLDIQIAESRKRPELPDDSPLPNFERLVSDCYEERDRVTEELERLRDERQTSLNKLYLDQPPFEASISAEEFSALAQRFPLPSLPDAYDGTVVDKVLAVVLATYEYITFDEIRRHPYFDGMSDKRVLSALKKNVLEKLIIEVVIDGETVYCGPELDGIEIIR